MFFTKETNIFNVELNEGVTCVQKKCASTFVVYQQYRDATKFQKHNRSTL